MRTGSAGACGAAAVGRGSGRELDHEGAGRDLHLGTGLDRNRVGAPQRPPRGSFQLSGDSTPKARKGKHVNVRGDGVEGVSHMGSPG